MKNFTRQYPVLTYFVLTFIISWGGILILGLPYGMPAPIDKFNSMWPVVFIPYLLGPLTAGILLISLTQGRAGMRELLSRLARFRVKIRWYAAAVLTAPVLVLVILLPLSILSPDNVPALFTAENKAALIIQGITVGFFGGGLLEETGWTGMAVPGLRRKHGILTTGLIVGFTGESGIFCPHTGEAETQAVNCSLYLYSCRHVFFTLQCCRLTGS